MAVLNIYLSSLWRILLVALALHMAIASHAVNAEQVLNRRGGGGTTTTTSTTSTTSKTSTTSTSSTSKISTTSSTISSSTTSKTSTTSVSTTSKTSTTTSSSTSPTPSNFKSFTMNVNYATASPDGYQFNGMMLANNQIDYPIRVNKGDTVSVTVNNQMNVSTSIHWHGMFQKGNPWMDGPAGATQCPIPPGGTFTYQFNVGNQVGTYWWHSHYKGQYVNGLRGPFIIDDPSGPYLNQYDEDLTITLTDFHHNTSDYLLA
ncbi:hypothetical protein HDU76_010743, partial [Blyttiomyces sp. JEL0837]